MKKVEPNYDHQIDDEDLEIDVQVNYRCFFSENMAFYPMDRSGSIYKGQSLQDFINEGLESYSKDYQKVEVVDVFIDI